MIQTFYSSQTALDTTGVALTVKRQHENGTFQVVISGVATVTLEGSLNGVDWVQIVSKTASDLIAVALAPYMRVKVTAYTSGTVKAYISE